MLFPFSPFKLITRSDILFFLVPPREASSPTYQARTLIHRYSNTYMSFPPVTCKVLEEYSIRPPMNENLWLRPWFTILTTLFPADNYLVSTNQDIFRAGCQRPSRSHPRSRETSRPAIWPSHNSNCRNKKSPPP